MKKCLFIFLGIVLNAYNSFAMARMPHEKNNPLPIYANSPKTLQECYDLALKRSETVAIQKESVNQTTADFLKAASEAIGDMDFVVTDSFQKKLKSAPRSASSLSDSTSTSPELRERKFVITQPLFQGFRDFAGISGAGSLRAQRKGEWERAKQSLFVDVATAYYSLIQKKHDLETIQGIHDLFLERIGDLGEREKIGRSRLSEVVTSQSRMKILEADLAAAKGDYEVARHLLEFLTGVPVDPAALKDVEILSQLNSREELSTFLEEVRGRPDVEASRQALKTAKRGIVVAQSGLWPRIDLEGNVYEKREGFRNGIDWDALFKIDVPIYRGGEVFGEIREAWSVYKKAKLANSFSIREAQFEVKEAFENWASALEQHAALKEAVEAAKKNYELQKDEYSKNLVNNLDVLTALESLLDTRRSANQVRYAAKLNYWKFQVARGNCCDASV